MNISPKNMSINVPVTAQRMELRRKGAACHVRFHVPAEAVKLTYVVMYEY